MPQSDSSRKTDEWETAPSAKEEGTVRHQIGRYRVDGVLGRGAFGEVYLAFDDELNRPVAIKVPRSERFRSPEDARAFMDEARSVASLDHPAIVPVYDFGSTDDGTHFVVSKYIDGSTLGKLISERQPVGRVAALVASISEALHHAHTRGLFHRDVKPANILLDCEGQPFITDFGIALKEEDYGKGAEFAGTPAYMSPEQARGEGHRVDGRADVFSLGVVLYEALTSRKPHVGESVQELLDRISHDDVRPPRQLVDTIPRELERICLKALARRASERYSTAKDFAEDLLQFVKTLENSSAPDEAPIRPAELSAIATETSKSPPGSTKGGVSEIGSRVVPKGLRPFDANDTEFFLELLPGPRDRQGLPDILRFWKGRLEEPDIEDSMAVGLAYGPSGCGKTSLIRAGVIPRLNPLILPIYIDASPEDTEIDLLRVLRRRCPSLSHDFGLVDSLTAIRRGTVTSTGTKVTLIIDQFEQWLQAHVNEDQPELVAALRQCNGAQLQCLVMVRDDFWMAATRFMRQLEIRLKEGENCAAVDLFDHRHAKKVLTAFGRAYGALPAYPTRIEKDQSEFVDQAISELSESGQIIPVRLTLFAEMMKTKLWSPSTLRSLGGASGVGVAFLEDTFSGPMAPPEHRRHEKAARAVLQALLPEGATKIRGTRKLASELRERSGYAKVPDEFDRLIEILDGGVRLITPSDPESASDDADEGSCPEPSYQLTHDYLVPSLREWIDKTRRRTMRDRAELRLIDRAEMWNVRPETRQLPSLGEWMRICALVPHRHWSKPQTAVMRVASRHHLRRVLLLALCLLCVGFAAWDWSGRRHAHNLNQRLIEADISELPGVLAEIQSHRRWTEPLLREASAVSESQQDEHERLRVSLALLNSDDSQIEFLLSRALTANPDEAVAIRDALYTHRHQLVSALWEELDKRESQRQLQAAYLLASYDPTNSQWQSVANPIVRQLIGDPQSREWMSGLLSVRDHLFEPLATAFRTPGARQSKAGELLIDFYKDQPRLIAQLVSTAPETHLAALIEPLRLDSTQAISAFEDTWKQMAEVSSDEGQLKARQARVAAALAQLGAMEIVLPSLRRSETPDLRSYQIEYFPRLGVAPRVLIEQLNATQDHEVRVTLLLSLGGYNFERLPDAVRSPLLVELKEAYVQEPATSVHSATEWLLRRWNQLDDVSEVVQALPSGKRTGGRDWYLTSQGNTMAVIEAPAEFMMGSPDQEPNRRDTETLHLRALPQSFALATTEVTVEQFQRFAAQQSNLHHTYVESYAPTHDCPQISVIWYEAAMYCNWLSEEEGLPPEQWCYVNEDPMGSTSDWTFADKHLERTGYRLPTEAEWEFACRAGTSTSRPFGNSVELMSAYAWHGANANGSSHAVATLKPNDLGMFDMLGNVFEWCHEPMHSYPQDTVAYQNNGATSLANPNSHVVRGGSYGSIDLGMRSASRTPTSADRRNGGIGFRVARTMPE